LALQRAADAFPTGGEYLFARHIKLNYSADKDNGRRTASVYRPRKFKRFVTIGEKTATCPILFTGHPMPITVLADQKDVRLQTRGRFGLISNFVHGGTCLGDEIKGGNVEPMNFAASSADSG
jgi:hypothetical protein